MHRDYSIDTKHDSEYHMHSYRTFYSTILSELSEGPPVRARKGMRKNQCMWERCGMSVC